MTTHVCAAAELLTREMREEGGGGKTEGWSGGGSDGGRGGGGSGGLEGSAGVRQDVRTGGVEMWRGGER